jgi:hypothetical protein
MTLEVEDTTIEASTACWTTQGDGVYYVALDEERVYFVEGSFTAESVVVKDFSPRKAQYPAARPGGLDMAISLRGGPLETNVQIFAIGTGEDVAQFADGYELSWSPDGTMAVYDGLDRTRNERSLWVWNSIDLSSVRLPIESPLFLSER